VKTDERESIMNVKIVSRLREMLKEKGITGSDLAKTLEKPQPQIWRYISGESVPKYDMQLKIAHILGVEVSEIWPAEVTQ
jgi:transcriptional regulator with XRE-family HTH domain